jgi:hypothetical protein
MFYYYFYDNKLPGVSATIYKIAFFVKNFANILHTAESISRFTYINVIKAVLKPGIKRLLYIAEK